MDSQSLLRALRRPWSTARRLHERRRVERGALDHMRLFAELANLCGATPQAVAQVYAELTERGAFEEIRGQISAITDLQRETERIARWGVEKYVRFDRTALYCLVRLARPQTVVETGTRWGIGSYFIARALEANGSGRLFTFDLGATGSRAEYAWPESEQELAFLLPERLRPMVEIVEGDALSTLPAWLPRMGPVDLFYHDSCHTYEHMWGEFSLVYPAIPPGGLFLSEDTDQNDAWRDFWRDKPRAAEARWSSYLGIDEEREVRGIRTSQAPPLTKGGRGG